MTLLWLLLALQIFIAIGTTYNIWLKRRSIAAQDEVIELHKHHVAQHTRLERTLDIDQEAKR